MHIGINAHLLAFTANYREAGLSKHIRDLVASLLEQDRVNRYTLYVGSGAQERPADYARSPQARFSVSPLPTLQPEVRIAWEQTVLPAAALLNRLDVLHCPVAVRPLLAPVPTVVTVHDLIFLKYPERLPAIKRFYLTALTAPSVRRATRVIAVSENTRRDITALLGVAPSRVAVVPNGVELDRFYPRPPAEIAQFKREHELPERMILYLGTLEPRKNLPLLIRAYASSRERLDGAKLVIGGGKGWFYEEIFRVVREEGLHEGPDAVRFTGYLPDAELPLWYNSASVFVYPSLYEGFGLPVLEAMACGVPVVSVAASAIPEVAGDAALLVPPDAEADLSTAIAAVLNDEALAGRLAAAGPRQAAHFPWSAAAQATIKVYEQAAASKGRHRLTRNS